MNEVLSFLAPKAGGETFLVLILITFILGFVIVITKSYAFVNAISKATEDYKKNINNCAVQDPDSYLRLALRPESTSRLLAPFPGVLVTIGILGTFIGIGMAIAQAIPALEHGQDVQTVQDSLKGLLSAVKFKFQTSAYGILASLIFIAVQTVVEWLMHRTIEQLTPLLAPHKVSSTEELAQLLANQLSEGIKKGFASLGMSLEGSLKQLATSTNALQNETSSLRGSVAKLSENVDYFGKNVTNSTAQLNNSSNKLGELSTSIDQALARVAESLKASGISQTQELKNALYEMNAQLRTSLTETKEAQIQASVTLQNSLKTALQSLNQSVENMAQEQRHGLKEQRASLDDLKKHQAEASAALQSLDMLLKEFHRANVRLLDLIEKQRGAAPSAQTPPPRRSAKSSEKPDQDNFL